MCTIEERLQRMVEQYPRKVAVISEGVAVSYAEFWARVQEKAKVFLSQEMVSKGRGHVIRASQSIDFLVTYFAVHLAGGAGHIHQVDGHHTLVKPAVELVASVRVPLGILHRQE